MGFLLCSVFCFAWLLGSLTCTFPLLFPIHPQSQRYLFLTPFFFISQIPDKVLERHPRRTVRDNESFSSTSSQCRHSDDESGNYAVCDDYDDDNNNHTNNNGRNGRNVGIRSVARRLSTFEDGDAAMVPRNGRNS